jgi:hypothetical protein
MTLIEQAIRLNFQLYGALLDARRAGNYERALRIWRIWHRAGRRTARRQAAQP